MLSATGAEKVDIVGHSQGTVLPNSYAQVLSGANHIDRYVSLAPLRKGSGPSQFAWPDASYRYAPGITYTIVMTRYDEVVVPYTDG